MFTRFKSRKPTSWKVVRSRFRQCLVEQLEDRRMLVVGGWHNVLQPLSVLEDHNQQVSPLDVLAVINEINGRRYSDANGRLPDQPPNGERPPFFDVNCNGFVDPLDVLQVINYLNGGPKPRSWTETISGGGSGAGFISVASCSPQLNEGSSLRTELTTTVQIPDANSAVQVTFRDPIFDSSSSGGMSDSFEITVRDTSGNLLVLPFTPRLEAAANLSEDAVSVIGPAVLMSQSRSDRIATINLVGIPGGTDVQVSVRLLNNDTDTLSHVIVRSVEVVPATGPNPVGSPWATETMRANSSIHWPMMQELTGSVVPKYARTSYTKDQSTLIAEVAFENLSTAPVRSIIAVIDNLSDLSISPLQPDGYTDDGYPYWRIASDRSDGMILANSRSIARSIAFASTADRQFKFDWRIYGEMRHGEVAFRSTPIESIAAGNTYRYQAVATSSIGSAIRYTMLSGPESASISEASGELVWPTNASDLGRHQIVIRATDAFGYTTQQSYNIEVRAQLANRPPIITSEPTIDAVVASPFEVQTYATGGIPLAATLLPTRSGLKNVVTANQSDNQLGILPSGPSLLGIHQPIDLGERPISEWSDVFEGPMAIELGIVPNTEGQFERNVQQVLAEDVNGDGNPDTVALVNLTASGNWSDSNDRGFLVVRYGNGDGSFREGWQVQFPTVAGRIGRGATVHFADVTSDGRKDMVVTTIATNRILVYANTETGTFDSDPITSSVAGNYISTTQIADLDRDGKLDLVMFENVQVQIGGRQAISVYRGDGTGRFTESQLITADTNNGGNGYLSDVDGLNGPDIVRLNYSNLRLETYLNDGTGVFGNRIDSESKMFYQPNNGNLFHPVSGNFDDFDGDGKVDAVIFGGNGANFMKGQGNGRFGDGTANGSKPLIPQQGLILGLGNNSGRGLDLNGDEHLDILIGNPQTYSNLIVGLGRGDGTFEMSMYSTNFESEIGIGIVKDSQSMAYASAADFNRDGVVDVLVGNQQRGQQAGNVGLLLGDLPGTFRAPQSLRSFDFTSGGSATTFNMRESVSGDFNNDGFLDLVTYGGIGFDGGFYFAPGRGDGTFGKYEIVFGGLNQYGINSLTTLDIDRDGKLDLAWIQDSLSRQAFGLGNGSFQALPSVSLPGSGGNFQNALQVDDLNRDGYPDLVHRLQTGSYNSVITRLVVLLYDPANRRYNTLPDLNDTITNWPRAYGYYWDESIGIGDLNGDGNKEFFAYSRSIPDSNIPARWIVFEQTGGSASDASTLFRKTVIEDPSFIPHDRAINSYVVDDFDGDGINDIAYSGNHLQTTVMFGNGDFTFRDPTNYYTHTFQVDSGDFNGDGVTDLVAMWGWGFLSYSSRPYQSVLYGRGDGTFSELHGFTAVANVNLAAIGDFNGDGQDDYAATPDGTQSVVFTSRPTGVSDVASGDLNGDGTPDLVSIISGLDRVKVNLQRWDESFERVDDLFTDLFPVAVELLDVDSNGMLDIVTVNQQGRSLSVLRQVTREQFEREDIDLPQRPSDLFLSDLNRDGRKDVLVLSQKDRSLMTMLGSNNTLSLSLVLPLGFTPGDLSAGDLNGDGIPDVGISDPEGDRLLIFPGIGDGTFGAPVTVLGVTNPGSLAIGDMNRDGRQDLVVAQTHSNRVGVFYQRSPGKFTTPQWIGVGKTPSDIVAEDANGDGATDLLVVNQGDDTVSLILNRFDPNRLWTYQPTAIDPDGDPVSFELTDAPGGMLLDPATNTIYWAPMPEQLGVNQVILEAFDGRGGATQQGFSITVTAPVAQVAPQFTSTPVTQVASDAVYHYEPNVVHQDQATVRYSLVQAPEGMTIDPTTGEVQWDPRTSSMKHYTGTENYGFIEAPDSQSLRPASVTVEGWYYFEDPKGAVYENLLSKRTSATNQNLVSFGLEYFYGTLRAKVGTPASNNSLAIVTAPAPVEFQKWTHVAMTFDDASKTLTLFINGESVGTAQSPEGISYNSSPLQSGRNIATLARQRIWNRALTPAEISSGMLADVPRDASGLVLQWEFNESRDATTIFDTSSSRNHGTLNGTPDWQNYPTRQRGLASQASHDVIVRVEDGRGGVAEQSFRIDIVAPFKQQISGVVFSDFDGDGARDLPTDINRIANGDFNSGNSGWETDFFARTNQPTTGWLTNSQSTVGPSSGVIVFATGYSGHTYGSSQDLMLVANGDNQDRVAWRQRVTVVSGQSFDFSFWALRPSTYEAARLLVRWNGQTLGLPLDLSDVTAGTWKQFRQAFTPTTEQGILEIVSLGSLLTPNPGLGGTENAFAIDDLMLVPTTAKRVLVPGIANPYLAGMPNGTNAYGSTAPQGSPPSIDVQPGQILRIRATGHTRSDGSIATLSPDGLVHNATGTVSNALNGISQYAGPNHGSLLGVFLDAQAPSGQTAPTGLDFRANGNVSGGINYQTISPQLRQLFFVGDGFTSDGIEQTIVVPQGATRLFLANSSSNSWIHNTGSFEVQVLTSSGEPVQPGRVVYLDTNRNQAFDPGEPTATTDINGRYLLSATGQRAHIGLLGIAGQLQSSPPVASETADLNTVTPFIHFGSRAVSSNLPPMFVSEPITNAIAPGIYRYQVFSQSPKGQRVQYELALGPQGMTLDPVSGMLQWSPLASQAGIHDVLILAFDADRQFTVQRYSLVVSINTAPIVTSTAPRMSQLGVDWQYRLRAQDAESSILTYRLISAPSGMTISTDSGIIDYVPVALGAFSFEVEVSDEKGATARQTSTVTVTPTGNNEPPRDLRSPDGTAIIDRIFASYLSAIDDDYEPLAYSLVHGPAGMTISSDGQLLWTPSDTGEFSVKFAVTDPRGGRAETEGKINVVSRAPRPTLMIESSPETAARVGTLYSHDVIAPGAVLFELLNAPIGMSIDPQFGTIRWIPTLDNLGVNKVTLRCTDLIGNSVTQEYTIAVRSSSIVPTISSAPLTEASVGRTYLYSIRTDNPSSSPLQYELSVAPVGMQIDSLSGEITWTPTAQQEGPTAVSIRVNDGLGNFSTQSYAIVVAAGLTNQAPVITSIAALDAIVGQPFQYTLRATDPENETVTFGLRSAPSGFTIDSITGVVTWTPQSDQVGTVTIALTASDSQGGIAVQSFSVDVRPANRSPEFRSAPVLSVSQGGLYQYDVLAVDPDREPLQYELLQGPLGMTIDSLGRVRWQTQRTTSLGVREVSIRVRDGLGAMATQSFTFGVVEDTQAPRLTIVVTGEPVLFPWTVHPAIVRVIATDNVGLTNVELRVDGVPVELAPDGTARVYFSSPGNGRLVATARDAAGNVGTAIGRINMRSGEEDGGGNPAPVALITSVGNGAAVRGFVNIVGTAVSPDFERYKLSYRRIDQTAYTLIRESITSVSAASLGRWDTTLLENDNYFLKLEVFDTFGSFAGVEVEVSVTGNLKLGNFRLSFEDMTIPVAGIPITIVRTYDTLRADRDSDFGYGWRMEYRNADLRVNLPKSGLEDIGIYTPFKGGTKVFLTMPGGTREGFTFTPEYRVLPGFGSNNNLVVAFPRFTPDRGVTSTLSVGSGTLLVNEFGEMYAAAGIPWNPASPDFGGYTLTTREGIQYRIDGATGLMTSVMDRNGNTLTFGFDGVTSQSENIRIAIDRDRHGRVTSITDPLGQKVTYGYSPVGDLITVTDREGNTTKMTYRTDRAHYLDTIIDPLGRTGIRNEYDQSGRLIGIINADGKRIQTTYDPDNQLETIVDPLGNRTVNEYDPQGNVIQTTDSLGAVTRMEYDANNYPTRRVDPLGRETLMLNDSSGFKISETDPRGHSTIWTYDRFGNETSKTDPLGNVTRTETDSKGNITNRTAANGRSASIQYSNQGLIQNLVAIDGVRMSVMNDRGNPSLFTTDGRRPIQIEYDAVGRPIAMTIRGDASNPQTEDVVRFELDANGRTLREIDGEGGVTQSFYDDAGNRIRMVDPLGRVTRYEYDFANRLVKTIFPDETEERQSFDAAGRRIARTDRLGRTTHYEFDAVGREITIIYPDGTPNDLTDNPRTRTEYDLAGQVTKRIDELGNATVYQYDTGGNQISMTNALNETWGMEYDANNRRIVARDPLGNTMRSIYDGVGNVVQQILPDGSRILAEYDGHGRVTSRVDGEGARTSFRYDAYGALIEVVDPLGHRTLYERNERGQATAIIDAAGRRTEFQFDKANRQIARKLPDGAIEQFVYDAAGQMTSMIDFMGRTTTYAYDINGRLIRLEFADGRINETQYNAFGQVVLRREGEATTTYTFDERNRLTSKTDPDGLSIQYVYDVASNLLSTTSIAGITVYSYDTVNRLQSITAGSDVTRYVYDAAGRKTEIQYSNGTVERREYDPNSRVFRQSLTGPEGILDDTRTTYDRVGRKISLVESTGRKEFFEYDLAGRLIRNIVDEVSGTDRNTTWLYDAVGNRLRREDSISGVTNYEYDNRDRLLTETNALATRYLYDANGNILSQFDGTKRIENTWDAANRLIESKVTEGTTVKTVRYTYSPDGERYQRIEDGETTRFLVDSNREHSVVIAELVNGVVRVRYVRPPTGEAAIAMIRDGQTSTLYTTPMGTTKLVTNPSGNVTDRTVVDPFGVVIARTGITMGLPIYNGEFRDALTGYDYLRARFYSPQMGRFASMDSFAGWQNVPISLNKYLYAHSDPVNGRDPSGQYTLGEVSSALGIVSTLTMIGSLGTSFAGYQKASAVLSVVSAVTGVAGLSTHLVNLVGKSLLRQAVTSGAQVEVWATNGFIQLAKASAGNIGAEIMALAKTSSSSPLVKERLRKAILETYRSGLNREFNSSWAKMFGPEARELFETYAKKRIVEVYNTLENGRYVDGLRFIFSALFDEIGVVLSTSL